MLPDEVRKFGRGTQMAIAATKLALEDAKLPADKIASKRVGVCLGTTMADIQALESANTEWIEQGNDAFGLPGLSNIPAAQLLPTLVHSLIFTAPTL